jgi:c(7)-type cytochrome triheme protein
MQGDKSFDARMDLLDIASAMASMHRHWNGDDGPLNEVDSHIRAEVKKEKERESLESKWRRSKSFLGNFIMKSHAVEMEAEGVAPALYPHWLHRIWYECKVCHDDVFKMKRWVNRISQKDIIEGRQCGVCHDGKTAFGADTECERCHIGGRPEAKRFHDAAGIDHKRIKEVAAQVGAEWNYESLPEGTVPVDRFKFIDWLELKRAEVFKPIVSLKKDFKDETRDNRIVFESSGTFVKDVLFDHKVHSSWVKCSTCHPDLFSEELGTSDVRMSDINTGGACGLCHGTVSFTLADCTRCHSLSEAERPEGALIRKMWGGPGPEKKQ